MVSLNWRGLDCGNETMLGESLVRDADGRGGNTTQCLFSYSINQIQEVVKCYLLLIFTRFL